MRKNIWISAIIILSAQTVVAAPAPWGMALNMETEECAGYWGGDEFVAYALPEGWKAYYPTYEKAEGGEGPWSTVKTDVGNCSFQIRKEEACCMELGYAYVSDNIGKGQRKDLRSREEFEKSLQKNDPLPGFRRILHFVILITEHLLEGRTEVLGVVHEGSRWMFCLKTGMTSHTGFINVVHKENHLIQS